MILSFKAQIERKKWLRQLSNRYEHLLSKEDDFLLYEKEFAAYFQTVNAGDAAAVIMNVLSVVKADFREKTAKAIAETQLHALDLHEFVSENSLTPLLWCCDTREISSFQPVAFQVCRKEENLNSAFAITALFTIRGFNQMNLGQSSLITTRDVEDSEVLSSEDSTECRELKKKLKESRFIETTALDKFQEMKTQLQEAEDGIQALKKVLETKDRLCAVLNNDISIRATEIKAKDEEISELKLNIDKAGKTLEELTQQCRANEHLLEDLRTAIRDKDQLCSTLLAQIKAKDEELRRLKLDLAKAKESPEKECERNDVYLRLIAHIKEQDEKLLATTKLKDEKLLTTAKLLGEKEGELATLHRNLSAAKLEAVKERSEKEEALYTLQDKLQDRESTLTVTTVQLEKNANELEKLRKISEKVKENEVSASNKQLEEFEALKSQVKFKDDELRAAATQLTALHQQLEKLEATKALIQDELEATKALVLVKEKEFKTCDSNSRECMLWNLFIVVCFGCLLGMFAASGGGSVSSQRVFYLFLMAVAALIFSKLRNH